MLSQSDIAAAAPALSAYTQEKLLSEVWKRPDLSIRDRSIVTVAALIARNQSLQLGEYLNIALDSGVTPSEISEIITHLAFYAGWGNATAAAMVAKTLFHDRGIQPQQLPPASVRLMPLNEAAEAARASRVEQDFGRVAPGVVQYTTELIFKELWL